MAVTNLYFYKTGFKIEFNGVYEELETFLSTLTPQKTITDYMYMKPTIELDRKIKIELDQSFYVGQILQWDYLKTVDSETGSYRYWFIRDIRWLAQKTVEVSISLDTLNSYWYAILPAFNKNTHITRRYKNRWTFDHWVSKYLYTCRPVIDDFAETLSQPVLYKSSETAISGSTWYLIYKTDNSNASDVASNPISVYALPKTALFVRGASTTPTLQNDTIYYMTKGLNNGESLTFTNSNGKTFKLTIGDFNSSNNVVEWLFIMNGYVSYQSAAGRMSEVREMFAFSSFKASSTSVKLYPVIVSEDIETNITKINPENYITCSSTSTITQALPKFDSWYQSNKTDTTIVKILELPYAPFELSYTDSILNLPDGWSMSSIGLKLVSASSFNQTLANNQPFNKTTLPIDGNYNLGLETKIYNSAYYQIKYVYGDAYLNANLEYFTNPNQTIGITFYCSTEMSSNVAFKFEIDGMKYESDFGQWLSSSRDLEKPYYTNEYLNYLRYGKKYDEQSLALSTMTSITNSGINTATSLALTNSNPVSALTGAVTTAISIGSSIASATNSINQKIENYQHQSSKASTTNSLSLFNAQTNNKLIKLVYEPQKSIKNAIANYFRLYGYACDDTDVPTFNNRKWSEYMVCEPSFSNLYLPSVILADITQRMKMGFRLYHYNGNYDLYNLKENIEQDLNVPSTTSEEEGGE